MSLYEKIYNVMCESGGLEKDKTVGSGQNAYKAVSESEVLNMLKPLFKKHKLIVFPISGEMTEISQSWEAEYKGQKETKTRNITQLKVGFKIVDIDTGETEILIGFGNGADSQDKGSGKAFTYAYKTMLSKTFMLFSGEDTDDEHSDDIDREKPEPKKPEPKKVDKPTVQQLKDLMIIAQDKLVYLKEFGQKVTGKKSSTEWTLEDYNKVCKELEAV